MNTPLIRPGSPSLPPPPLLRPTPMSAPPPRVRLPLDSLSSLRLAVNGAATPGPLVSSSAARGRTVSGGKAAPPQLSSIGTPSHSAYHAASAFGSSDRKKTPPTPSTFAMVSSSISRCGI